MLSRFKMCLKLMGETFAIRELPRPKGRGFLLH